MSRHQRSLEVRLEETARKAEQLRMQKQVRDLQDKLRASRGR